MAFSVSTLQGLKPYRTVGPREFFFLPGNPGTTYTRGNQAYITRTEGVLTEATNGATFAPFTIEKTVVCPAATQAFPKLHPEDFVAAKYGLTDKSKTLVLVSCSVPAGTAVRRAKLGNLADETVTGYAAAAREVGLTTGFGSDDRINGALLYVYEGPGAGEWNIVEDYDHTGGTYELMIVTHRAFNATLTTASKMIILGGTAAAEPKSMFTRIDLKDADEVDVQQGSGPTTDDDGDFMILAGFRELAQHLPKGWVPIANAGAMYV